MARPITTHEALCALNDAVQERFVKDQQQLTMSDADWQAYTDLLRVKVTQIERGSLSP